MILDTGTAYKTVFCLSLFWIGLSWYWSRLISSLESYTLANRKLGLSLSTASILATWITSSTMMLAPQLTYEMGMWGLFSYLIFAAGLFAFAPLAKRIKVLIPDGNTCGDFFRIRYGKRAWNIFLPITIFYSLTWLVSMAMAGGLLLETLSGIPYTQGVSIILLLCVTYTLRGGLYAVVGTDAIQSVLLLLGIAIIGVFALERISVSDVYARVIEVKPELMNIFLPSAIIAFINTFLFGVGEIFHGNIWWSRVFAMKAGNESKAFVLAGLLWLPVPVITGYLAFLAFPLGIELPRTDVVGPLVAAELVGETGVVVVFIVVFCSLVSSTDSLLASTADLISHDILRSRINCSEKQALQLTKLCIVFLGVTTCIVTLPKVGTLATVLFFAGPLVGSTIAPIIYGLFSKRARSKDACLALVLGSVSGLMSYFFIAWTTGAITSVVVSTLCMHISSKTSQTNFSWQLANKELV